MFPKSGSNYATIPTTTSTSPSPPPPPADAPAPTAGDLLSRLKNQAQTLISAQRPWPEVLNASAISLPSSLSSALSRLRLNAAYFRSNYALALVAVVAFSLLWHPGSLLLFAALAAAWFFLFFSRSGSPAPIVVFGRAVEDSVVLGFLSVATLVVFLFTDMGANLFGALMIGLGLVLVHAVFRATDDLPVDQLPVTAPAMGAQGTIGGFVFPVQQQTYVRVV